MELQIIKHPTPFHSNETISAHEEIQSSCKSFIEANTIPMCFEELKNEHIIPTFKDNEPLISHSDFIETAMQIVEDNYHYETILKPSIRVSHPIKGRIPTARNKPANDLLDHEKTLYYERMAFVIEIPSVHDEIDSNKLSLSIGGVKSFNQDNLYNKKGADEHFKIFIGFKNLVCTNLCIWTDGLMNDIKVNSIGMLKGCLSHLINNYNGSYHMNNMRSLSEQFLTEQQFAQLIGKLKMHPHLPRRIQNEIPALYLGDIQISTVVKDYYNDESFCRGDDGRINLWRLYNLFTNANKSSYIDNFVDRSVNAYSFVEKLKWALDEKINNWYLS